MKSPDPSMECSNCGLPAQLARGIYQFRESGMEHVYLVNIEMIRCSQCGNEDPIIPQLNELMRFLALAVVRKPCPLNGTEVRFLRKFLKMTGEEFGRHLGVTKHTLSKWENGADPVGPQSDRLIRVVTVSLSQELGDSVKEICQLFPEIESALRSVEYKIDPEAEHVQYA